MIPTTTTSWLGLADCSTSRPRTGLASSPALETSSFGTANEFRRLTGDLDDPDCIPFGAWLDYASAENHSVLRCWGLQAFGLRELAVELEEALVAAFDQLGFEAVPKGGNNDPDGLAEAFLADRDAAGDAGAHGPDEAGADPGHALEEAAAVDAVAGDVLLDLFYHLTNPHVGAIT